jgi:hypothetical protein
MRYNIDDPASDAAKRAFKFRAQPQIVIVNAAGNIVASRLSQLTYTRLKADLEAVLHECACTRTPYNQTIQRQRPGGVGRRRRQGVQVMD